MLLQEALVLNRLILPIRLKLTEWLLEVGRNAEAVRTISPMKSLVPDMERVEELDERGRASLAAERAR